MNPPLCARCGLPVVGIATNQNPLYRAWHGECYAEHAAEAWAGYEAVGGVGASSWEERVEEGLELP